VENAAGKRDETEPSGERDRRPPRGQHRWRQRARYEAAEGKRLEAIVVERHQPTEERPQHLCLDKGYDNPTGHETVATYQYTPHIRRIGEEKLDRNGQKTYPARRWMVEWTLAWLSKCRGLLVQSEKKAVNFLGLRQLACVLLWTRRRGQLIGD
jgi:putative transposase